MGELNKVSQTQQKPGYNLKSAFTGQPQGTLGKQVSHRRQKLHFRFHWKHIPQWMQCNRVGCACVDIHIKTIYKCTLTVKE